MSETPISSVGTFFMKVVFPIIWLAGFGWATTDLFSHDPQIRWEGGGTPPSWAKWVFLAALIVGTVVLGRIAFPLKSITLSGNRVVISNYISEIIVPLTNVGHVAYSTRWTVNNRPVAQIVFKTPTAFGSNVLFYPRSEESYNLLVRAIEANTAAHRGDDSGSLSASTA